MSNLPDPSEGDFQKPQNLGKAATPSETRGMENLRSLLRLLWVLCEHPWLRVWLPALFLFVAMVAGLFGFLFVFGGVCVYSFKLGTLIFGKETVPAVGVSFFSIFLLYSASAGIRSYFVNRWHGKRCEIRVRDLPAILGGIAFAAVFCSIVFGIIWLMVFSVRLLKLPDVWEGMLCFWILLGLASLALNLSKIKFRIWLWRRDRRAAREMIKQDAGEEENDAEDWPHAPSRFGAFFTNPEETDPSLQPEEDDADERIRRLEAIITEGLEATQAAEREAKATASDQK